MLKALLSARITSGTMCVIPMLQQRHAAANCLMRQKQVQPRTAFSVLPSIQQHPAWGFRGLHSTAVTAAAAADDTTTQVAEDDSQLVYEADDWDIGYINFVCVTGTLQKLLYEEQGGHKWVKLQLSVPTPGSNGFTNWTCLGMGDLAAEANVELEEGMIVQAGGTLLQRDSINRLGWGHVVPLPALFAESFGKVPPSKAEELVKRVLLPVMDDEIMKAFVESGGQPLQPTAPQGVLQPSSPQASRQQQQQRAPSSAGPIDVPGMPQQPANDTEAAWMSVFKAYHLWVDQRTTKTGRQPDFKMRMKQPDGKDALWLTDSRTPDWVKRNLQMLPGGIPFPKPDFIPAEALSGSAKDQAWVELFTNYSAFWDNRMNKLSPRGPDFVPKNKDGGLPALWLNELPPWAQGRLDTLPEPPPPRH